VIDSPLVGLLLLGALVATPLVLRRLRAAAPDGLRVLGRTALHKGAVVAVVAVGERRFVLGAGEKGVQLLTELAPVADEDVLGHATVTTSASTSAATTSSTHSLISPGRTDAVTTPDVPAGPAEDALAALLGPPGSAGTTAGPGIGLVDRLRSMTVRTTPTGRPIRVPLRR
jgi:flagellar biogenesis protein FliO